MNRTLASLSLGGALAAIAAAFVPTPASAALSWAEVQRLATDRGIVAITPAARGLLSGRQAFHGLDHWGEPVYGWVTTRDRLMVVPFGRDDEDDDSSSSSSSDSSN